MSSIAVMSHYKR